MIELSRRHIIAIFRFNHRINNHRSRSNKTSSNMNPHECTPTEIALLVEEKTIDEKRQNSRGI